jgi:hypothetical protein
MEIWQLSRYGMVFSLMSRAHILAAPFQVRYIGPYSQRPS